MPAGPVDTRHWLRDQPAIARPCAPGGVAARPPASLPKSGRRRCSATTWLGLTRDLDTDTPEMTALSLRRLYHCRARQGLQGCGSCPAGLRSEQSAPRGAQHSREAPSVQGQREDSSRRMLASRRPFGNRCASDSARCFLKQSAIAADTGLDIPRRSIRLEKRRQAERARQFCTIERAGESPTSTADHD